MDNLELVKLKIEELQGILGISRMPTIQEIRLHRDMGIEPLINKLGGSREVSSKLNIPMKIKTISYSEKDILDKLSELIAENKLKRMPVSSEVLEYGGHPLHNGITRKGGYRYFADKLGLPIKESETSKGNDWEYKVKAILEEKGHKVDKMSTGHPYDLMINDVVKVDVKVAGHISDCRGSKSHTFGLNKREASCDIYICVCLNEEDEVDRLLIIPSHHVKIVTLCIGEISKYNIYNERFDYISQYVDFFKSI